MQPKLRALVVEDNQQVREAFSELLEDEGLEVVGCASAEAALDAFSRGAFDVVLTDISLPMLSGIELARCLLAQQPDMWLVFVSGYVLPDDLQSFGPRVRSLLKPFELDKLHLLIEHIRTSQG